MVKSWLYLETRDTTNKKIKGSQGLRGYYGQFRIAEVFDIRFLLHSENEIKNFQAYEPKLSIHSV